MAASGDSPVERFRTAVRVALIGSGALVLVLVMAYAFVSEGGIGSAGPAVRQVAALGLLLLVAGALTAPAAALARALVSAPRAGTPEPAALTRSDRRRLGAIVVVAFAFRVWMIAAYWPANQIPMGMSLWDAEMARNLLAGRGWVLNWDFVMQQDRQVVATGAMLDPQDFFPPDDSAAGALQTFPQYAHTPGYSVWLAASFLAGGAHRFIYSQWMQAALDAAACLLVFGIGRRLWSTTAGLFGALLYAISPAHVFLAIQTVAAATDSFWVMLVTYGIVRAWHSESRGGSPWPGVGLVVLGAFGGTMMNSTALLLPLASAAWACTAAWLVGRHALKFAALLLVAQAILVALLVPWGLRNRQVYGHFTLARSTFWQLAWETFGEVPNKWGLALGGNDEAYFRWIRTVCPDPCSPAAREAATRDYLLRDVIPSREFPGHLARLLIARLPGFVYVSRLPADKPYPGDGAVASIARAALAALNAAALLIIPAAALGFAMIAVRYSTLPGAWFAFGPTLFVLAFSLLIFVEHRKTTPAFGYLLTLSGVAGAGLLRRRAGAPE